MVPRRSRAGFPASDGGRNTVFLMVISPRKPASPRSLYHPGRRMSCHATSRGSMFLDSGQSHAINGSHSWWASATASYPSAWYHRSRSATESRLFFDATPSPRYGSRSASASGTPAMRRHPSRIQSAIRPMKHSTGRRAHSATDGSCVRRNRRARRNLQGFPHRTPARTHGHDRCGDR